MPVLIIIVIALSPILRLMYLDGLKEFNFADMSKMERFKYRVLVDSFWSGLAALYVCAIFWVLLNYDNPFACDSVAYIISCVVVIISIMPPLTMPSMLLILGGIGALCDLIVFVPIEIIRRKLYMTPPKIGATK